MSNFKSCSSRFSTVISCTESGPFYLWPQGILDLNNKTQELSKCLLGLPLEVWNQMKLVIGKWVITWKNSILNVRFFLLLVTDINVKFNEHVLMRARHLNLSQKRLQPQLRNALALSIRVSLKLEFLAANLNLGTKGCIQDSRPQGWYLISKIICLTKQQINSNQKLK